MTKQTPPELDRIADVVLNHRLKHKEKPPRKRKSRAKKKSRAKSSETGVIYIIPK